MTHKKNQELAPIVRLSIANNADDSSSQFGPGVARLCVGVRDKGSLNAAAKDMKMAYSKAWRIVKETEASLGIQLLDRDGAHGSTLTDEGNKLIEVYLAIEKRLTKIAEDEFAKRFAQASLD